MEEEKRHRLQGRANISRSFVYICYLYSQPRLSILQSCLILKVKQFFICCDPFMDLWVTL